MSRNQEPGIEREDFTVVVTLSPEQLDELAHRVAERLQVTQEDGYLNAKDAAAFLGLTPAALYARVGRGQITPERKGKRVFFTRAGLRAYMEDPTPED
jgi:hypothetical protein